MYKIRNRGKVLERSNFQFIKKKAMELLENLEPYKLIVIILG